MEKLRPVQSTGMLTVLGNDNHDRNRRAWRLNDFFLRLTVCITGLFLFYVINTYHTHPNIGQAIKEIANAFNDARLPIKAEVSENTPTEASQKPLRMIG